MSGQGHYFTGPVARAGERFEITVPIAGRATTVEVASGVFSPHRVDPGTAVLLQKAPPPPGSGDLLDLGCGWGPIALTLARESPKARIWAVDVSERARDLTERNATRLGLANLTVCAPELVPTQVRFAALYTNPPIRIGKPALHALLQCWLLRLADDGSAHLVVQRNLGADSLARWLTEQGYQVRRTASAKGYRVLAITPPGTGDHRSLPAVAGCDAAAESE